MEQIRGNK